MNWELDQPLVAVPVVTKGTPLVLEADTDNDRWLVGRAGADPASYPDLASALRAMADITEAADNDLAAAMADWRRQRIAELKQELAELENEAA